MIENISSTIVYKDIDIQISYDQTKEGSNKKENYGLNTFKHHTLSPQQIILIPIKMNL